MTLVGRLDLSNDGRPLTMTADGETATVTFSSLKQAWSFRRQAGTTRQLLDFLVARSRMKVRVRMPGIPTLTLSPRPSLLVRLFLGPLTSAGGITR